LHDAFLQQILLRPARVLRGAATLNLNGDYISDALAAQVGGIGIAPGANLSDTVACFEATHGTASKYAGKDYVNPGSVDFAAEMMLRHMGWREAADLHFAVDGESDSKQEGDVRLRPPDGRRHPSELLRLWSGHGGPDVACPLAGQLGLVFAWLLCARGANRSPDWRICALPGHGLHLKWHGLIFWLASPRQRE